MPRPRSLRLAAIYRALAALRARSRRGTTAALPGTAPIWPDRISKSPTCTHPKMDREIVRNQTGGAGKGTRTDRLEGDGREHERIRRSPRFGFHAVSLWRSAFSTVRRSEAALRARFVILLGGIIVILESVGWAHGAQLEPAVEQPFIARQQSAHARPKRRSTLLRSSPPTSCVVSNCGSGRHRAVSERMSATVVERPCSPTYPQLFAPPPAGCRATIWRPSCPRGRCGLCQFQAVSGSPASSVRAHCRADSGPRSARCRAWPSYGSCRSVRPRPPLPSPRNWEECRGRPDRTHPHGVQPSAPTRPARSMRSGPARWLDRDVVNYRVIGALEESRVDRAERAIALRGKPADEGHAVLSAIRHRRCGREIRSRTCRAPCQDGMAAVIATTLAFAGALRGKRGGKHCRYRPADPARPLSCLHDTTSN